MYQLRELCFEITNKCYANCIFCSTFDDIKRRKGSEEISFEIIVRVISEFKRLGGQKLEISGGEPLLHSRILDIVGYALENDIEVVIYTSGILNNTRAFQNTINQLASIGLKKIVFNCQGLGNTHNFLLGKRSAFDKLIDTIQYCRDYLDLWIGIHFVPCKRNYFEVKSLYNYLSRLAIDEFAILRLVKQGRAKRYWSELSMDKSDYLKLFEDLRTLLSQKTRPFIGLGHPLDFIMKILYKDYKSHKTCHAGKFSLDIMVNGDVVPCPAFKDIRIAKVGNIFEDFLEHIWINSRFLKELRNLDISKIEVCNSCSFREICNGGCVAQRLIENKSIVAGPDPLCKLLNIHQRR